MKVAQASVVTFEWTLLIDGKVVDHSPEGETQTILINHAHGLPPRLEAVLHGREAGETFTVSVPPSDAYGEYDPAKRISVPRSSFPASATLKAGASFYTQDTDGKPLSVRVIALEAERVVVDANPERAGKTLEYRVTVHRVRAAETEELEHGHVHGEGGVIHHHHGHDH
jgi:FKBP-type peptidyl-prolyl cis-trans isomerase SlyD